MTTVNISSSQKAIRVPRKKIAALVALVSAAESADLDEVDIAIVTARRIAALNRRYLRHRGATDVLSFDLSQPGGGIAVQLIVCGELAVREARARGLGPQRELMLYVLHGLLHVLGYDDTTPQAAEEMRTRQEELLEGFYRDRRTS